MPANISLRISTYLWRNPQRRRELLALLKEYRDTIGEVAFFTSFTHPPLPYATVARYAAELHRIIPQFKALGLRTGINHLSTIGHLDENLENSLNEPWQKITDINGTVSRGSYCPLDPGFQGYVRDCYRVLAEADPDFIWIDDDVRMGHHPPAQFSCFCPLCLQRFAAETGTAWTRDSLAAAFAASVEPDQGKPFAEGCPPNPLPKTFVERDHRTHMTSCQDDQHDVSCACGGRKLQKGLERGLGRNLSSKGSPQHALPSALVVRRQWLEHNRRVIDELLVRIGAAVDEVRPGLQLGFMSCMMLYEGFAFERWRASLARKAATPVKWRPGGGFYTDATPLGMLGKVHGVGRVCEAIPAVDTDIQYEHENFPYQKLKKSETAFIAESCAALGAGCTGVALNLMGISQDPFTEYLPYFAKVRDARPFFDRVADSAGRSATEGVWAAMTPDLQATFRLGQSWNGPASNPLDALTELAEIGIPPAYSRTGAKVHLLAGEAVRAFSRTELEGLFSESVLLDGEGLAHLQAMGLQGLAGFAVAGTRDRDTIERFTADPLNGDHAGWHRDCRPSFWRTTAYCLKPLAPTARVLAELIDFSDAVAGPVLGVCENRLGGRVAVAGYYPWTSLQCLAKTNQMKALIRWLGRERLPALVESYHKAALWCRRDAQGRPVLLLLNASLDAAEDLTLLVRDADPVLTLHRCAGRSTTVKGKSADGAYRRYTLPRLAPWEAVLVTTASEG